MPQIPPPPCVGTLHTVDVAGVGTDGYGPVTTSEGITVPSSNPTDNPTFVDIGGSIYEGRQTPLCDQKLVHVSNGRSIAPTFNLFTDVPVPARFWGLLVDDLDFSADKKSLLTTSARGASPRPPNGSPSRPRRRHLSRSRGGPEPPKRQRFASRAGSLRP